MTDSPTTDSSTTKRPANKIRWGILGPGKIAHAFAADFQYVADGRLSAVASRSTERARAFAAQYDIPFAYGSYGELAASPEVDAVYVAVPHSHHYEAASLCLEAGKAVLCEKPLTVNSGQAEALFALAERRGSFLMEALWSKFNPVIVHLGELIASGAIGEVRRIHCDFGFVAPPDPGSRLRAPGLAGGALLDIGIYTLFLPHMLWGLPAQIDSHVVRGETGVDVQEQIILQWPGARMAVAEASLDSYYPTTGVISGTEGYIQLAAPFFAGRELTLWREGSEPRQVRREFPGKGYQFQVDEVNACLRAERLQSRRHSWEDSLALCQTMDRLRKTWGITYPGERAP
ncbi:Gfo/Idh/MocA family oxidoreductase [Exilibacterium tricleocarpae]|uniref:Gfo/Idh/MocA family oxidoreductase n=1 Tax=Exilibacterium tricleocarpae TaxID=2591008 RepID=A0A545TVN9_9GAMM|nr:Gfo/Idh/MocA family oxidoreductase [Exilibacterium tricleocarpae]TQV81274.1 Gfo/Idh/MocA family oxidoreductase [Exilibacterium tricleocarpae]